MKLISKSKLAAAVSIIGLLGPVLSLAADTTESLELTAGSLSIGSSTSVTLTGQSVTTADQTSTGTVTITPSDLRGSGAGFTASVTSTNINYQGSAIATSGTSPTSRMGFSGTYNGVVQPVNNNGGGRFRIQITTGGAVGTAVFKWIDPAGTETTGVTTASSVTLSSGISATFTGTQVVGDVISLIVGNQRYTDNTATPSSLSSSTGADTNSAHIVLGSAGAFSGSGATSSSKSILVAEPGAGLGAYSFSLGLSQNVRKNSVAGTHTGTLTVTIA